MSMIYQTWVKLLNRVLSVWHQASIVHYSEHSSPMLTQLIHRCLYTYMLQS